MAPRWGRSLAAVLVSHRTRPLAQPGRVLAVIQGAAYSRHVASYWADLRCPSLLGCPDGLLPLGGGATRRREPRIAAAERHADLTGGGAHVVGVPPHTVQHHRGVSHVHTVRKKVARWHAGCAADACGFASAQSTTHPSTAATTLGSRSGSFLRGRGGRVNNKQQHINAIGSAFATC